jgi:hypothetical protein
MSDEFHSYERLHVLPPFETAVGEALSIDVYTCICNTIKSDELRGSFQDNRISFYLAKYMHIHLIQLGQAPSRVGWRHRFSLFSTRLSVVSFAPGESARGILEAMG